jgi:hypothetical protein
VDRGEAAASPITGNAAVNIVPSSVWFQVMSQPPADIMPRNGDENSAQVLAASVAAIRELAI